MQGLVFISLLLVFCFPQQSSVHNYREFLRSEYSRFRVKHKKGWGIGYTIVN